MNTRDFRGHSEPSISYHGHHAMFRSRPYLSFIPKNPVAVAVLLLVVFCTEQPRIVAAEPTYWNDIRPLLRRHCTVCHKVSKLDESEISAGLALDSLSAIHKGGKVPVLVPGQPNESLLVTLLTEKNPRRRMPLDADPLPPESIATIRRWVELGAPEGVKPADDPNIASAPAAVSRRIRKLPITFPARAADLILPIGPLPPVTAVAFSPDGALLATGIYGRVTVWNLSDVQPIRVCTNILGAVHDLKYSPDGSLLAVAGGQPSARGDLRLFSTRDWSLVRSLGGHLDTVTAIDFSPDGSKLVSASFDKTLRLWDVNTGQLLHTFTGHSDFVYSVKFGPKGDWYVTASKDRSSRMIDTATGQSKFTFSGSNDEVLTVTVTPDGSQVITSGLEPQLTWWDAATAAQSKRQGGHGVAVHELAMNRQGTLLASAGADQTVKLWNLKTAALIKSLPADAVLFAVALDPDGKRVAAGGADGRTRIWETAGGRQLLTLWSGPGESPHGSWLAQASEGYVAASPDLVAQAKWQTQGKPLTRPESAAALVNPTMIARLIRGETVPPPAVK